VHVKTIIVIGGGITGCAAAWHLALSGHRVRLLEARRIAAMASGWTLGGVRQSGRHPAELPLARAAVKLWPRLADQLGFETGYHQRGNIRLARNLSEAAAMRELVSHQRMLGLDLEFLDGNAAVRGVAPAVSDGVTAASFCPSDGFADAVAATTAFAHAAQALGAELLEDVTAKAIVLRNGRTSGVETSAGFLAADAVILAAGIHSPALLRPLGLDLPIDVTLVQVVQTEPVARCFEQVFGVANADCAGRQEPSGRFRFTSGIELFGGDTEYWTEASLAPSAASIATLRARVAAVLPIAAATPIARSWGGLIDATPDHLPVIDAPGEVPGLVIAAGFSGHGFGIGPISGRLASELALNDPPSFSLHDFRLARFAAARQPVMPLSLHG
jgi:sarcosine oxidase subunit beta